MKIKDGQPIVLVGTTKGAFLFSSDRKRTKWKRSGPHFPGHEVYALGWDGRGGRRRLWAGAGNPFFGTTLCSSDDFGGRWSDPVATLKFPPEAVVSLKRVWQIALGTDTDTMYCGVEPAALFESRDAGKSWSLVRGLFDHPHRARWEPGGGGLCLHTILVHPGNPRKIHIAISAAGVYRTDDGGKSWRTAHKGVRAEFRPDKYPEFGQCVHKVVRHRARPATLFLQNHFGLYRSDDDGDSWKDIANGVPSDFGFAMAMHPHDPDQVFIVPLDSDQKRWVSDAKLRVYRTKNGGKSWKPRGRGLPQKDAYETVLRDGLATDTLDPAGLYFGTRSGKLFGSRREGERWSLMAEGLPPVTCVKAAVVGEA